MSRLGRGAEGSEKTAPLLETTELKWKDKIVAGQLFYVPEAGTDLWGRDLTGK